MHPLALQQLTFSSLRTLRSVTSVLFFNLRATADQRRAGGLGWLGGIAWAHGHTAAQSVCARWNSTIITTRAADGREPPVGVVLLSLFRSRGAF